MDRKEAMAIFSASPIYAITAEKLSAGRTDIEVVQAVLAAGVRFVQYREKEKDMRTMYAECRLLRDLTRKCGAVFIIDDFVGLAHAVDADGQGVLLLVGFEVGGGDEQFPDQGARLFFLGQMGTQESDQRRLGAVGDHLDGVGEHFPQGAQLARALVFRQRIQGDFSGSHTPL